MAKSVGHKIEYPGEPGNFEFSWHSIDPDQVMFSIDKASFTMDKADILDLMTKLDEVVEWWEEH